MTALEAIRAKICDEMNDITDALATGGAEDFAAYKYLTGHIFGLARAERHLLDIVDAMRLGEIEE
jgi:hypothetical protein